MCMYLKKETIVHLSHILYHYTNFEIFFYVKLEHKSGTRTRAHFAGSGDRQSLFLGLFKRLKLLKLSVLSGFGYFPVCNALFTTLVQYIIVTGRRIR